MAIQIRRGSNAEWEANNSNIVVGEPAVATDSKRAFIGTASGAYMELANLEAIAPAYDTGNSYAVDDYVSYQGKLYVCTVPTSGAWNASCWQVTTLGQALAENAYSNYETYTMNGDIVSFSNGAGGIPVKGLQVSIEAVQSGSGDPSPTNIRPISGWDEVNVTRTGKNLWGGLEKKRINNDETRTTSTVDWSSSAIKCVGGSKVTLTIYENPSYANGSIGLSVFDSNGNLINAPSFITPSASQTYPWTGSVTLASNADRIYVRGYRSAANGGNNGIENIVAQLEYGTATDYSPYNGQTYTIDLNGTRYGGTLDVTTGVLTITHGYVDLGTLTWVSETSAVTGMFRTAGNDMPSVPLLGGNLICSQYKGVNKTGYAQLLNGEIAVTNIQSGSFLRIIDVSKTSLTGAQFKTAMSGVQLAYQLYSTQTVQLSPTQVTTLLGQNNIWADSGEVEVTYRISNVQ